MNGSTQARRGTAAVELAAILPILLIFLLGVWEIGRFVEVSQLLSNAAREGGRQASTSQKTTAQVQNIVVEYLQANGLASVTASNVTVTNLTSTRAPIPRRLANSIIFKSRFLFRRTAFVGSC